MGRKKFTSNRKVKPKVDYLREEFREVRRELRRYLYNLEEKEWTCDDLPELEILKDKIVEKIVEFDVITQQLDKLRKYYDEMYKEFVDRYYSVYKDVKLECFNKNIDEWNKYTIKDNILNNNVIVTNNEKVVYILVKRLSNMNKKGIIFYQRVSFPNDGVKEIVMIPEEEFNIMKYIRSKTNSIEPDFIVIEEPRNESNLNTIISFVRDKGIVGIILTELDTKNKDDVVFLNEDNLEISGEDNVQEVKEDIQKGGENRENTGNNTG